MPEVANFYNMSMYELVASSGFNSEEDSKLVNYSSFNMIHLYDCTRDSSVIIRSILASTLFRDSNFQNQFMELFNKVFQCVKFNYDSLTSTYTFRIKKTSVKKIPNYNSTSNFYYPFVAGILATMIKNYKNSIVEMMITDRNIISYIPKNGISVYEFCFNTITVLASNQGLLSCLFDIQCISDNIVQIRL